MQRGWVCGLVGEEVGGYMRRCMGRRTGRQGGGE